MRRVLCLVGIPHWEHHVNREMGGKGAGFDLCSHCGREKKGVGRGWKPRLQGDPLNPGLASPRQRCRAEPQAADETHGQPCR